MQIQTPDLEMVKTITHGELVVHVFAEPATDSFDRPLLPPRDMVHFYVTGPVSSSATEIRNRIVVPNQIAPSHGVLAYVASARVPDGNISRADDAHADVIWMDKIAKSAIDIAKASQIPGGSVLSVDSAHIQALARSALAAHKASMSECAASLELMNPISNKVRVGVEVRQNAYRALEAFYMLQSMGLRSNPRALIAAHLGKTDNQVKNLLAVLQKGELLLQRPSQQSDVVYGGN